MATSFPSERGTRQPATGRDGVASDDNLCPAYLTAAAGKCQAQGGASWVRSAAETRRETRFPKEAEFLEAASYTEYFCILEKLEVDSKA
jgi:hypothetical protein